MADHFTKADFEEKVLKANKPVVVDFYAEWCGPCQMAMPVIEALAEEYKDKVVIGKINVDEEQELAQKYDVKSIPTIIVFKEGKEVDRKTGFPGEEGLKDMVEDLSK
jgi:thioredoxin